MEYLSRLLTYVGKLDQFQFHPRCKAMNLNHPCFADDLVLFCKGNYASFLLLMRALHTFSEASGLYANNEKSEIFCANVDDETKLRMWGTKNLSYAGRVQLRNSVLLSLHTYWATVFLLPQKLFNKICSVCRAFLWTGCANLKKSPLVAWRIICDKKSVGGLGIRDSQLWNTAAIGKYVWNIAQKSENLWVKWVWNKRNV